MSIFDVSWEFGTFQEPTVHTVTQMRIPDPNNPGVFMVFTGTNFTYDGDNIPTGGTIQKIELVVVDGVTDVVLQRMNSVDMTMAQFGDFTRAYVALHESLSWIDTLIPDLDVLSLSTTRLRLANEDGTITEINGSGFDVTVPGTFGGNVTTIRHIAMNGTTVLETVNANTTLNNALTALGPGAGDTVLFALLNLGDSTLTGVNMEVTIGADTYFSTLFAGVGNDTINAGPFGGIEYEYAISGVNVNLVTGAVTGGAGTDTLTGGFTDAGGSNFNDTITGTTAGNHLTGRAGADTLTGGGGDDILDGGDGDDTMVGGAGIDTADFFDSDAQNGLTLALANTGAQNTGFGNDTLSGIENVIGTDLVDTVTGNGLGNLLLGNSGNDTLDGAAGNDNVQGGGNNDILAGKAGDDILSGGDGNDRLGGGVGADVLNGGGGADIFIFNTTLNPSTNVDTISDYNPAQDTIRLENLIFTGIGAAGPMAASAFFKGATAHDANDRIIYDQTTGRLYFDIDGTGGADQILFAQLTGTPNLTIADFVVI